MDLALENRVALVTGGSRGIGFAIAEAFARERCRLAICARDETALREAAATLERTAGAGRVLAVPLDITDRGAAATFTRAAADAFGAIDILINNAGGNRRIPFAQTTDEDWDDLLEWNLLGALRMARAAIPYMRERGRGVILFTVSIWGREAGGPGYSLYTSTRAAAIGAAKVMATELAAEGIRVLTIAPGSILFPGGGWDRRVEDDPDGMADFIARNLPLGRFGTPAEVADVVAFLCSDRASLVTGASFPIDGGQSRSLI